MSNPPKRFPNWNLAASSTGPSCWGPSATNNASWSPDYQSGAGSFGPPAPVQPASARTDTAVQSRPLPLVVQLDDDAQIAISLPQTLATDEQILAALQDAAHRIAARLAARRRHAA